MDIPKYVAVAAFMLVWGNPAIGAQLPPGYSVERPHPLPDSLRESWSGGRFTIVIQRAFRDSLERSLIEQAESLFPPADTIVADTRAITGSGHVAAFAEAVRIPGRRWWWRDWDNVLLPYALTGAAVSHYVDRVRSLSTMPNPFGHPNAPVQHRASMVYNARVLPTAAPGVAYSVELSVEFGFYCGPLCMLSFSHSRTVDFDQAGKVVAVRGDGPPRYIVS